MLEKFKKFELDISQEKYFSENIFIKFQEALKKRCVRTLTKNECFFAWSFIKKYQPKVFLELGGQHGHPAQRAVHVPGFEAAAARGPPD